MKQYNDLIRHVRDTGQREPNRTGIDTITTPGEMLKFDLRDGFPAVTTKKLAFKSMCGELVAFLRGATSAADFRALGCGFWDQNANENKDWLANPHRKGVDDLGPVYGSQWRKWGGQVYMALNPAGASDTLLIDSKDVGWCEHSAYQKPIDQLAQALHDVRHNSQSRRIIVSAWNPAVMDRIALPACHIMFQLLPRSDGTLHMCMYQRSVDVFLGLPHNIGSYALLLELFAKWTGRIAATSTMFLADTHIYVDHLPMVEEQLSRTPYPLPTLDLNDVMPIDPTAMSLESLLDCLKPEGIKLVNYQHHPAIKASMAV
jgi:thymidylate synthase